MSAVTPYAWDSYEWESYGVTLLRQRYGVSLTPVPDKSGGDGGLDAFTSDGIAWQCYASENEPLALKKRYELQRNKITTDLQKLIDNAKRVQELLGAVVLTEWVLLTPKHESSDLVAHCSSKTKEMRERDLPFISKDFHVHVQDLTDFTVEHRTLQAAHLLPDGLYKALKFPDLDHDGHPFEKATGPLIGVMDGKLNAVVSNDAKRGFLRGEYLKAKVTADDKLAHFDDSMPDVAEELREVIAKAKRRVEMAQTLTTFTHTHLGTVESDLAADIKELIPELSSGAITQIAQGSITQWMQECSMRFDDPDEANNTEAVEDDDE